MCQPGRTLVLVREKNSLFSIIPTANWPHIPSPRCLGLTLIPLPPPPAAPAAPPCAASPQEPCCPLIWSDTATYSRRRSSQRRLSYPRVPAVRSPLSPCSYGSVTIEQSHMGAPLHCMLWSGPTEARSGPTARTVVSLVEPRRKGFNFKVGKDIRAARVGRLSVGALCFTNTNPEKRQ